MLLIRRERERRGERKEEKEKRKEGEIIKGETRIFNFARNSLLLDRVYHSVYVIHEDLQYRKVPFAVNHFNYFQAESTAYLISIFRISRFSWINPAQIPPSMRLSAPISRLLNFRFSSWSLNKHAKCDKSWGWNLICYLFPSQFLFFTNNDLCLS